MSGKESATVESLRPWQDLLAQAKLGKSTCRGWPGGCHAAGGAILQPETVQHHVPVLSERAPHLTGPTCISCSSRRGHRVLLLPSGTSLRTRAGEMETCLAFVLSPRSLTRLRVYLAALFSRAPGTPVSCLAPCTGRPQSVFEGEVEMSRSTRSGLSSPARATVGQPAFANSCRADFYRYESQKEPGEVSGGIWVFGGYRTSAS